jgi:hypothetical protein
MPREATDIVLCTAPVADAAVVRTGETNDGAPGGVCAAETAAAAETPGTIAADAGVTARVPHAAQNAAPATRGRPQFAQNRLLVSVTRSPRDAVATTPRHEYSYSRPWRVEQALCSALRRRRKAKTG